MKMWDRITARSPGTVFFAFHTDGRRPRTARGSAKALFQKMLELSLSSAIGGTFVWMWWNTSRVIMGSDWYTPVISGNYFTVSMVSILLYLSERSNTLTLMGYRSFIIPTDTVFVVESMVKQVGSYYRVWNCCNTEILRNKASEPKVLNQTVFAKRVNGCDIRRVEFRVTELVFRLWTDWNEGDLRSGVNKKDVTCDSVSRMWRRFESTGPAPTVSTRRGRSSFTTWRKNSNTGLSRQQQGVDYHC